MATPIRAQPVPNPRLPTPVLPTPTPLPETEPLPPLEELLPQIEDTPSIPQPSPEQIPGTIIVKQFQVIGSTVFTSEELAPILEPFTQRPISFAQLLEAQDAITQFYQDRGYLNSGAFIPPQTLQNGVVTIEVIEGEVEAIEVTGTRRLKPSYIRSRLALATQAPLNQERLLTALQLLQLDPLIENLSAELAAGSRPGLSQLEIKVQEADAFSSQLTLDNQRSPSVGSIRRQLQLTHGNLLGFGDRFNLTYSNTDGNNTLDDISYTLPINPRNRTLSLSYSRSQSNIIEEPFDRLNIESKSRSYELTYRHPLKQTPTVEFALGLTASRQETETSLLDMPFPLSAGANDNGETKISALRFFQEYTQRSNRNVFALRSQFTLGINAFNATINSNAPDSEFFAWRGQAQYLHLLAPDTILVLRSDLQLADQALVPLEQFSVGGQLTVRGYRQDTLLADNGLFASAELRFPILRIPDWKMLVQVTPFFDFGTVWNSSNSDTDIETSTLSSVGLGLRFLLGNNFNARLDWGVPLVDLESNRDNLQEKGIYFSIQYTPF
ncbi:MAG TPA: hemolysin activation/secretion protein [Cyanobacteria bacterium UBA11162]|nr:hemolysin activation/secretion protein [Cyanobacteria bacterium UBA11162]